MTRRPTRRLGLSGWVATVIVAVGGLLTPTAAGAAPAVIVVPGSHATIQAAVNAAQPGDRIIIRPGTFTEQVSITKSVTITGSGPGTIIRAPGTLALGPSGVTSIVEIGGGASVTMSALTVSGPGSGTCAAGALRSGLKVGGNSHLDLSFAAVTHVRDTPLAACFHSGDAIVIGDPETGSPSTASIRSTNVNDYQGVGILVINEGSRATIANNVVTGQGLSPIVATDGIEMVLGAVATVSNNIVSGNACGSSALGCGPDFFEEFQHAGISGGGPGTVVTGNVLSGNQVGVYVGDSATLSQNTYLNNHYFGLAVQDGSFTVRSDRIIGGFGGVAVIAAFADTSAVLDRVVIARTTGPPVQTFACCGFTATVANA